MCLRFLLLCALRVLRRMRRDNGNRCNFSHLCSLISFSLLVLPTPSRVIALGRNARAWSVRNLNCTVSGYRLKLPPSVFFHLFFLHLPPRNLSAPSMRLAGDMRSDPRGEDWYLRENYIVLKIDHEARIATRARARVSALSCTKCYCRGGTTGCLVSLRSYHNIRTSDLSECVWIKNCRRWKLSSFRVLLMIINNT